MKYGSLLIIVIVLLLLDQSFILAQNRTLRQCGVMLQKQQQAIFERTLLRDKSKQVIANEEEDRLQQVTQTWVSCVKGITIPPFRVATIEGELIDAIDLKGKITVINFWFMSCHPCLVEIPALNRLVEEYKAKSVVFIGFSPDKIESLTNGFLDKNPFYFTVVGDAKPIADSFGVVGYPTTFIVNQEGKVSQVWQGGPESHANRLEPYFKAKIIIDSLLSTQK